VQHPQASLLRAAARFAAKASGAAFDEIADGANAVGLARVGAMPLSNGRDAGAMLAQPPKALVTWHAGSQDTSSSAAYDHARSAAQFHVYIGAYACDGVRRTAHAVLPIGLPPETDGSYVNLDGVVQRVAAGAKLPGDARPGWRVLRALGAQLGLDDFDFVDFRGAEEEMAGEFGMKSAAASGKIAEVPNTTSGLVRIATVPIYRGDAVLRRCPALQSHPLTGKTLVGLHADDAKALGLADGDRAKVVSDGVSVELPVAISRAVPRGAAWIDATWRETRALPATGSALKVAKA
jgi:NADH-quinone oxidoreductase subunit G